MPLSEKRLTRRELLRWSARCAAVAATPKRFFAAQSKQPSVRTFRVEVDDAPSQRDAIQLATRALQDAIDAARAAGGGRVIVPAHKHYRVGTLQLRTGVDLHLEENAELIASANPADYNASRAVISAAGESDIKLSGLGKISGSASAFMRTFVEADDRWEPGPFRPRLVLLRDCEGVEVSNVTLADAPQWTLHLLGCAHVLVDGLKIRNSLQVPNCDGIDPDHCRDVEIRDCDIECGDDAIVIKASRETVKRPGCANILVKDCRIRSQSAGLKIGTETTEDIRHIRFERCQIETSARGIAIQLRDSGSIDDVVFRDISLVARYHPDAWWGLGEGISLTALPRRAETILGSLTGVVLENIRVKAENSVRVCGHPSRPIRDVRFKNVQVNLSRWTPYPGGRWDNRPPETDAQIETHATSAFAFRHAENIRVEACGVIWGGTPPEDFAHALEAQSVKDLQISRFSGEAAHPSRDAAIRWI